MRTAEESAREILRTFSDLKCLRVGGAVTYQTLATELYEPDQLDAGLRHAVMHGWLLWGPNMAHTFTLTEVGYHAGAQALA